MTFFTRNKTKITKFDSKLVENDLIGPQNQPKVTTFDPK